MGRSRCPLILRHGKYSGAVPQHDVPLRPKPHHGVVNKSRTTVFRLPRCEQHHAHFAHLTLAHTSFYSAYRTTWGANLFQIGWNNALPANRIVPQANFKEKYKQTFSITKEHVMSGKHVLGYHKAPKEYANTDNAISPAWRGCAMLFVTSSSKKLDHSTPKGLAIANKDLQQNILQPWCNITPVSEGGRTYLNEATVMESDWQESFYGGYHPRLSEIKKKWDSKGVFYATTAVGSERWKVKDGNQGVQT
jgi:hypothetical protein